MKRLYAIAVVAAFVACVLSQAMAFAQEMALPRVVVSSGGPHVAQSTAMQTFQGSVEVTPEYVTQPLGLVCTNGSLTAPGYNWVRMFLLPDDTDQQLQATGQPIGRMIIDERSFENSPQAYLNMTGQLKRGANKYIIEAAGPRGSSFSWELRSIGAPSLYYGSGPFIAGQSAVLYGNGFSLRADENIVSLNGQITLPVMASSESSLKIFVPKNTPPGTYKMIAAIRNFKSTPVTISITAPPEH